ncbi:Fasciclin domain-containing protein [Sphingobacterium nematocida]|uniref:Fasciclin domain-containing protein n=1 Tax=Sphingobacterium nematocida TaxID=1513896 RepID=A0A1T5GEH9_9SPHI|nr:fasciclin domain-containing protein [Sphingobacterium nematocida]SKC06825.1 Fasciclin domain-containing protein [Sphingobacterium nematocida]
MVKYSTLFIGGFIACCMLLCIQACKDKFSDARYDSTDEIQIMDYLDTREDLSIFREMIDHVGQRNLLKTAGSYTVFAPTNAAFEKLFETLTLEGKPIKKVTDAPADYWLRFFRYHILDKKVNTNVFIHGPLPSPTAYQGKYLIADISGSYESIRLNNVATIKESNINFNNGFVNVLDAVLPPPTASVYEMMVQSGKYNTMLSIFEETDLIDYLKDSIVTVLVESDDALNRSKFNKDDIKNLKDWASYHIIPDSGYYLNLLTAQRFYPLYKKEALSFSVDTYGQYKVNGKYKFNQTAQYGIDKIGKNGIYHSLDTVLEIVAAVPSRIRLNLYPPGSSYGAQNVFTQAPASIRLNNGTQSYHQDKKPMIVQFDATQAGDYFWMTVPDVPAGKYRIRLTQRLNAQRGKFMTIYNDKIVKDIIDFSKKDGDFEEYNYFAFNYCGDIEVEERSDVKLNFVFMDFGSNKSPSYCCDLLLDILELIPIN